MVADVDLAGLLAELESRDGYSVPLDPSRSTSADHGDKVLVAEPSKGSSGSQVDVSRDLLH